MKGLYALFSFMSVVGAFAGIGIGNGYVILFAFLSAFLFFPLWISSVRKEIKESPDYDPNDDSALCTQKELVEKATRLYFDEGKYSEAFPYLMRLVKESPHKVPKTEKMLKAREISQLGEFCHALLVSFGSLHPNVEIEDESWQPIFDLVNSKSPLTVQHFKETIYEDRKNPYHQQNDLWMKASAAEDRGDMEEAINYYKEIIALGITNSLTPYESIRKIYKKMGKHKEAILIMEEALKMMLKKWSSKDEKSVDKINEYICKYKRYVQKEWPEHKSQWLVMTVVGKK